MNDDFQHNLQQHHDAVGVFIELLENEQAMLTGAAASVDPLARLTERKAEQARTLERLDQQRRALLIANGYGEGRDGGERAAEAVGCTPLWQALLARIEAARVQNRINGMAIGNRLDQTSRTLSFLQRATGQQLYGPNGRARSLAGKHSLRSGV